MVNFELGKEIGERCYTPCHERGTKKKSEFPFLMGTRHDKTKNIFLYTVRKMTEEQATDNDRSLYFNSSCSDQWIIREPI